jgi:hypothetical protein
MHAAANVNSKQLLYMNLFTSLKTIFTCPQEYAEQCEKEVHDIIELLKKKFGIK